MTPETSKEQLDTKVLRMIAEGKIAYGATAYHLKCLVKCADEIERLQCANAELHESVMRYARMIEQHRCTGNEPRTCQHHAVSPKGTMFYHGFVDPRANIWRCDVCKGMFEGNLTEPNAVGSQDLVLIAPVPPPPARHPCDDGMRARKHGPCGGLGCDDCDDGVVLVEPLMSDSEIFMLFAKLQALADRWIADARNNGNGHKETCAHELREVLKLGPTKESAP